MSERSVIEELWDVIDDRFRNQRPGSYVSTLLADPKGIDRVLEKVGEEATEFGLGLDLGRRERFAWRLEGRYFHGRDDESGYLVSAGINYQF